MAKRVQSPSSIGTYKQCPRKYYYQYIEKLPTTENIHTIRGNIAHTVLENFFDQDVSIIVPSHAEQAFRQEIQTLFISEWRAQKERLDKLTLPKAQEMTYFEETLLMLFSWLNIFMNKLKSLDEPFTDAFKHLTPVREKQYRSATHGVRGFIDAIETVKGVVRIMDYKTSKSFDMDKHRLQLSIYSLLYYEKHNHLPDYVGIYFLKGPEKIVRVDASMIEHAKQEVAAIHKKTISESKTDYPQNITPLCKWRTGQCAFYEECFEKKSEKEELITLRTG